MELIEVSWLHDEETLKEALQGSLHCSGQQLKKYFSSKQLQRPVKSGDELKLPLTLVNHLLINPEFKGPKPSILTEDSLYIALHKPPGVHCHPLDYSDKDTLLNYLVEEKKFEAINVNTENYDRGLLHRLDYETSGVVLLAKTDRVYQNTRHAFSQEVKRKFYWAIVNGDFDKDGLWTHHFKATGVKGSKQKVFDDEIENTTLGTMSVMKVTQNQGKSLLLINLKTGLRHQIRAQLAHLGFPIVGDELYGGVKAERIFLHALRYEWMDIVEDPNAELFDSLFDLNGALQMSHDMLGRF
ncbi:MAG: RNA pseudouridine synthase [Bdellovibrionota bacterium]